MHCSSNGDIEVSIYSVCRSTVPLLAMPSNHPSQVRTSRDLMVNKRVRLLINLDYELNLTILKGIGDSLGKLTLLSVIGATERVLSIT